MTIPYNSFDFVVDKSIIQDNKRTPNKNVIRALAIAICFLSNKMKIPYCYTTANRMEYTSFLVSFVFCDFDLTEKQLTK